MKKKTKKSKKKLLSKASSKSIMRNKSLPDGLKDRSICKGDPGKDYDNAFWSPY